VSNWLGAAYQPEERRAMGICLSVVRGRLTDRQTKRLFAFLEVDELEERDPIAILDAYGHVPATQHSLPTLNSRPRWMRSWRLLKGSRPTTPTSRSTTYLENLHSEASAARRQRWAASRSQRCKRQKASSGPTSTFSGLKKESCPATSRTQKRKSAKNAASASSASAVPKNTSPSPASRGTPSTARDHLASSTRWGSSSVVVVVRTR